MYIYYLYTYAYLVFTYVYYYLCTYVYYRICICLLLQVKILKNESLKIPSQQELVEKAKMKKKWGLFKKDLMNKVLSKK